MPPIIMRRGLIDLSTRTPLSIARLSAPAPSSHDLSLAAFTISMAESSFRYTHRFSRDMEDQNDLARSAARASKANVVTGGKGDKAELAAQPLLCTGRRNTWKASAPTIPNPCPV